MLRGTFPENLRDGQAVYRDFRLDLFELETDVLSAGLAKPSVSQVYAREFPTTEVNYSFYRLPKASTYENWSRQVPENFVFAVKASRFITHIKRLQDVDEAWHTFVHNARHLGDHLGPILLQFPPSAPCDVARLKRFLAIAQPAEKTAAPLRLVLEFRHDSWFTDRVYRLLNRYRAALCIADSARYARRNVITSDFAYLRFHGPQQLFSSKYPDAQLAKESEDDPNVYAIRFGRLCVFQ